MDGDAPAWVALSNRVLSRSGTVESLRAEDARRDSSQLSHRWVIGEAGQARAAAHLYAFPFDPPGFLHASVFVAPEARGGGLGQTLWQMVRDAVQEAGANGLAADVDDRDPASLAWAQRRGFRQHAHRFASELDLTTFAEAPHMHALAHAEAQGVTFADLSGADGATLERYLNFVAGRLTETPDLAGHPRWPLAQVREILHLDHDPHPDWLILAVGLEREWLGTTAMVAYRSLAYNELTATHPQARGRGLALPLKLHAIRRAREAGFSTMRTNNHSTNAPMLAVNRRLGFQPRPGRFEMHLPLTGASGA